MKIIKPLHLNSDDPDLYDKLSGLESAYYLDFQLQSVLNCLHYLCTKGIGGEWGNKCEYYHFYTDHLLFSMGQISNRFIINDKTDNASMKALKQTNQKNYVFSSVQYPILADKRARNAIEHIDERNHKIIMEKKGVGGFCVIDDETDTELANKLRNKKETQPYILDLVNNELLIRYSNEDLVISLGEIKKEILALRTSVREYFESLY